MEQKVITRFAVATEETIAALAYLNQTSTREVYAALVPEDLLEQYLINHLGSKKMIDELNNISNQCLVVYCDDDPVGYALLTPKGPTPEKLSGRKTMCIAHFCILKSYQEGPSAQSLLNKCLHCLKKQKEYGFVHLQQIRFWLFLKKMAS